MLICITMQTVTVSCKFECDIFIQILYIVAYSLLHSLVAIKLSILV